jgi:hypothetical protein
VFEKHCRQSRETLINSEFPATHGRVAILEDLRSLKMRKIWTAHCEISTIDLFMNELISGSLGSELGKRTRLSSKTKLLSKQLEIPMLSYLQASRFYGHRPL